MPGDLHSVDELPQGRLWPAEQGPPGLPNPLGALTVADPSTRDGMFNEFPPGVPNTGRCVGAGSGFEPSLVAASTMALVDPATTSAAARASRRLLRRDDAEGWATSS